MLLQILGDELVGRGCWKRASIISVHYIYDGVWSLILLPPDGVGVDQCLSAEAWLRWFIVIKDDALIVCSINSASAVVANYHFPAFMFPTWKASKPTKSGAETQRFELAAPDCLESISAYITSRERYRQRLVVTTRLWYALWLLTMCWALCRLVWLFL